MRTWDDWSDKEVSDGVAKIVGTYSEFCSTHDYCNSWADMGPLMFDWDISIFRDVSTNPKVFTAVPKGWWSVGNGFVSSLGIDIGYTHPNPLRAAAIVFLMMNGVKP